MFIDASAIVAILNNEVDSIELLEVIMLEKKKRYVSPLVRFEATAAIARSRSGKRKPTPELFEMAGKIVSDFCDRIEARDITITHSVGEKAQEAAAKYGKFVGHPADLNFGDCFAYGCAKSYGAKLVYKGNDFSQTDLS